MHTPDNIVELEPNQIFVFGSNLHGHHLGGAAKLAFERFGALYGVGEGLMGQSYAFPTLDAAFGKLPHSRLKTARNRLYEVAKANTDKVFLLTKVGCGIAGFKEDTVKKLFVNAPENIVKPEGW